MGHATAPSPAWAGRRPLRMNGDTITRYGLWMAACGARPTTVRNRVGYLRRAHAWLGHDLLGAHPSDVEAWWASQPGPEARTGARCAARGYVAWAHDRGLLDPGSDPACLLPSVRRPHRLPRPVPDQAIRDAATVADPRGRTILALSACSGLRAGEIATLSWEDVDLAAGTARIVGKGGRPALVPLGPVAVTALRDLGPRRTGPVIRNRTTGGHLSSSRVSGVAAEAFSRAGHPGIRLHQCRHRYATVMYRSSHDLVAVSRALRHRSLATTQVYVRLDDQQVRRLVVAMPDPLAA